MTTKEQELAAALRERLKIISDESSRRNPDQHMKRLTEQARQHRNQGEKHRAGESQPRHRIVQEIRRWFTRSHPRNVTAVLLQIIRDLRRLELRRHPKVAEEENHRGNQGIVNHDRRIHAAKPHENHEYGAARL